MIRSITIATVALGCGLTSTAARAESLPLVVGVVKTIDASSEKLTIEHEAIPNLAVGEATMIFKAASSDMLKNIKAGEKIRFSAIRVNGQVTITSLLAEEAMLNGESCE